MYLEYWEFSDKEERSMIEFCLDTGDLEMVKKTVGLYPVSCFSMNPSIAVNCLKGTGRSFLENAREIRGEGVTETE